MHGEGFCMGNILKYAQRYGRKGGTVAFLVKQSRFNEDITLWNYHVTFA